MPRPVLGQRSAPVGGDPTGDQDDRDQQRRPAPDGARGSPRVPQRQRDQHQQPKRRQKRIRLDCGPVR